MKYLFLSSLLLGWALQTANAAAAPGYVSCDPTDAFAKNQIEIAYDGISSKTYQGSLEGISSEGGQLTGFYDKSGNLFRLHGRILGETGYTEIEYILHPNSIEVIRNTYGYAGAFNSSSGVKISKFDRRTELLCRVSFLKPGSVSPASVQLFNRLVAFLEHF